MHFAVGNGISFFYVAESQAVVYPPHFFHPFILPFAPRLTLHLASTVQKRQNLLEGAVCTSVTVTGKMSKLVI